MMELDWSVVQILETLKKLNLEKNTLVILTSDNGPWLNYGNHAGSTGGLREGKGATFEGGNRVPCIMYWKGTIEAGTVCNKLATNMDILPTLANISGAALPEKKIDGVSLTPLLKGENRDVRDFFCYYYRKNSLEAVTDGRYKLIFPHKHRTYSTYEPGNDGKPGKVNEYFELKERQLFDLRRDPGERYNVISQYPEIVEKLEKAATATREERGDDLTGIKGSQNRPLGTIPK